jgi:Ca-activated chloride channel family protein
MKNEVNIDFPIKGWNKRFLPGILLIPLTIVSGFKAFSQKENTLISRGNQLYKEKKFDQSQQQYKQAVNQAPANPTANYNLGNAQFRKNSYDDASNSYNTTIEHSEDKGIKEKGYYNKGIALIKQQKTDQSIEAWKNALKIDPADNEARENLEKALLEKKSSTPKDQKNSPQRQNKQNQQQDQKRQQQQPRSKLSKQQVDQLLKALQQRENEAQEKMNQNKSKSLTQPDKDW